MTTLFISHSSKDDNWAVELKRFLESDEPGPGYEAIFLDIDSEDGLYPGVEWERALYQNLRQARAVVALCTKDWLASPWCVAEALIAREKGKKVLLIVSDDVETEAAAHAGQKSAARLHEFLKDTQFIEANGRTRTQVHRALHSALKRDENPQDHFDRPAQPYPGLKPFTADDAGVFYGRDSEVEKVYGLLGKCAGGEANRFLLVLGASGSGKSSLVRAGVVPRIAWMRVPKSVKRTEHLRRGDRWVVPNPFRGGDGLRGLSDSLALACQAVGRAREHSSTEFIDTLVAPARAMGEGTAAAVANLDGLARKLLVDDLGLSDARLVLLLDQLEEVFGSKRASDSEALLQLLLAVSRAPECKIVVLATLRSDFLAAFQTFPNTAGAYEPITLDPMSNVRFEDVIRGPAGRFGIDFDPWSLPATLVKDAESDDALPLLAHTLQQLHQSCGRSGPLTQAAYETLFPPVTITDPETGKEITFKGVAASIKKTADEILSKHHINPMTAADSPQSQDLRRAFYLLAQVGETNQFTRRTAAWSRMPAPAKPVLDSFVEKRLLTKGSELGPDGKAKEETVSVTHEALFRVWDRLRNWLESDRAALALHKQIRTAAADWRASGHDQSRLWSDERVIDTMEDITRSGVELGDDEDAKLMHAFLGPTGREELETLPYCSADRESDKHGTAWRLPLGHESRARVGDRLALMGDHRPGTGLRADGLPDMDWCPVTPPSGKEAEEVTIEVRSNETDPDSELDHTVTQEVRSFWIGRYPVTVSQYRVFLERCYVDGCWCLPESLPFSLPENYPPPKPRARHGNRPVDSVNWWDAVLFCAWLSEGLQQEIRLPTEFEWQLAASGGDASRIYPWGRDWDPGQEPWRANTMESELGRSTAVGLHPQGAALCGALDMSGTLWEWCANAFDRPEDSSLPESSEDRRALRGGSWSSGRAWARCASRFWDLPGNRFDFGFRVLCSSPILDH